MSAAVQAQAKTEVRTYGGWREPRSAGIGVLTMRETMAALGGLIVVIAAMMITNVLWAGVVLAVEAGVLHLVTNKDKHRRWTRALSGCDSVAQLVAAAPGTSRGRWRRGTPLVVSGCRGCCGARR